MKEKTILKHKGKIIVVISLAIAALLIIRAKNQVKHYDRCFTLRSDSLTFYFDNKSPIMANSTAMTKIHKAINRTYQKEALLYDKVILPNSEVYYYPYIAAESMCPKGYHIPSKTELMALINKMPLKVKDSEGPDIFFYGQGYGLVAKLDSLGELDSFNLYNEKDINDYMLSTGIELPLIYVKRNNSRLRNESKQQ